MRGISPVIATIIILAVTVAIAIAVVGWITGLWGGLAGGTEQLVIYPDSYINASSKILYLHVRNEGGDITIDSIEVVGLGKISSTNINTTVIAAGSETWISANITTGTPVAGTSYTVKLYTKGGNVFTAVVQAKS